ncbi:MAG: GFA family protein [Microcystis panniformis]|jgi:hypothetical protein
MSEYNGGCLCKNIRYEMKGEAIFPHFCSCSMCQRWSGAPALAWFDCKLASLVFNGSGGQPTFYRSSETTQRGFCPICGSLICALDDGSDEISITIGTLDEPNLIVPESQSYRESAPSWLSPHLVKKGYRVK